MANISKITLPNGQSYDIKDTTARNTGKVSGVKGNQESNYRTGNVNLTPENIGAFKQEQYAVTTIEAGIRPLVDHARANRLAFLPADQIIIEKTTDGGNTWEDAEITDDIKERFFSSQRPTINLPRLNEERSELCGIRFIITGMKYNVPTGTSETEKYNFWNNNYINKTERYFNVRQWWFWVSAESDRIGVQIYRATGANPNNWVTVFNKDFRMEGWSGSDWIRAGNGTTFGGSTNQTGNNWNWKIVFWSKPQKNKTEFTGSTVQGIAEFRCYGDNYWVAPSDNYLMRYDHLYSWDKGKNAAFPAKVSAASFSGNGSLLTSLNGSNISTGTVAAARIANLDTSKITTGTLSVSRGGTGQVTAQNAANAFINALDTNSVTPGDTDYYIAQVVGGGTSNTNYNRKPVSALWEYIKSKISSILGLTATTYSGSAAKVNNHTVESDVPPNLGGTIVVAQTQPNNQNIGDIWLEISTT